MDLSHSILTPHLHDVFYGVHAIVLYTIFANISQKMVIRNHAYESMRVSNLTLQKCVYIYL